jgi:PDZ domain-containing protein
MLTPPKLALAGGVLAAVVVAVLLLVPADGQYLFLPDEPHLVAPLVKVERGKEPKGPGAIYFVDVIVRKPTLFERLFPGIHDGASLVPAEQLNPGGLSEADRRRSSLQVMTRSQQIAAAVALRQAGYEVDAEPTGALVAQVVPDMPAAGKILPADVIVGVDGRRVRTLDDLQSVLRRRDPGDQVEVEVAREQERRTYRLELVRSEQEPARGVIGVIVEQDVSVDLPLEVTIDAGNVGGPSAGLAFALGVLEELGEDADHGHRIAVTGEIELDGDVAPVGGIEQKTVAAREEDVDAFLVPAGENAAEARRHAGDVRIIPVRSFQQALQALATLPAPQ